MRFSDGNMDKQRLKKALQQKCFELLRKRAGDIEYTINEARNSANAEEKSSAGDKYETSRAMGHLTQEMLSNQLADIKREMEVVSRLNTDVVAGLVTTGSVVMCNGLFIYLSVGLGFADVEGVKVLFLSQEAPLAKNLSKQGKGFSFAIRDKQFSIEEVF